MICVIANSWLFIKEWITSDERRGISFIKSNAKYVLIAKGVFNISFSSLGIYVI